MAYKMLFFFESEDLFMEEIGKLLEETRESMDISLEEASSDLKVDSLWIEEIEKGNVKAFDDVVNLKYFLKDYAKYLGLDYEEIVDEYNEFLFEATSKISLEDIKEAKRMIENKEKKSKKEIIKSPYTYIRKEKSWIKYVLIIICSIAIIGSIFCVISKIKPKEKPQENVIR